MSVPSAVVVGAGVMGASAAYHLAARGWRDVHLLDAAETAGRGSTGAATGGFRAQFATAINVRLSLLARDKLRRFREEIGVDPGYRPAGYLWLAGGDAEMAALRAGQAVQHAEGLTEAVEVTTREVARLNPSVRPEGLVGGVYCPTDGFLRPRSILSGYLDAAVRLGARVEWGTRVTGFGRGAGGRIDTVITARESISTDVVVNAAGPWAAGIASMAGVELPVVPLRRQVAVTVAGSPLPEDMPMTIYGGDGFHLRVRDGRVLLLLPSPGEDGNPFGVAVDRAWVRAVTATARERVLVLREVAIDDAACYAGLYEMSPDKHAILGAAPGCPNLYLINGSSGHGVMHAPALGQLLAEIICDGSASTLDARALRPERFGEGAPNSVSDLL